jgi:3-phenylpropionate/cinnamic acid dioxygenase small subunit
MPVDRHSVEGFLFLEARLLDEHHYDEWLALWAEDALYWVPSNRDDLDPKREVSIIHDDRERLEERIFRLTKTATHAQDPRSRTSRLISNVEVQEGNNGEVVVFSNFNLTELRRGKQDTFAGRTVHRLRTLGGGFQIVSKKVLLVNNDDVFDNLTFLV